MNIRITPGKLSGKVRAISSKSDVNRFLFAAALAVGESSMRFTTLSEDIATTISMLCDMQIDVSLFGKEGDYEVLVSGGTHKVSADLKIDAHECGTAARIALPIAAALCDSVTLTGKNGLLGRPFGELTACMSENGVKCSSDFLPITTCGRLKSGIYKIRGDVSSQYISGLLFALPLLSGDSEIHITTPLFSSGYVDMTLNTLKMFGVSVEKTDYGFFVKGNQTYKAVDNYTAEGDWSSATFWLCAAAIGDRIEIEDLRADSLQKDKSVLEIIERSGAKVSGCYTAEKGELCAVSFDGEEIPDALPALATMLALASGESVITGGSRLKIKESDRISTTVAMLENLGADIVGTEDGFVINGVDGFCGGEVDAANDHRIVMCAAVASQMASGDVIIRGAESVNKSYPTFFEDFEKLGGKYCVIDGE